MKNKVIMVVLSIFCIFPLYAMRQRFVKKGRKKQAENIKKAIEHRYKELDRLIEVEERNIYYNGIQQGSVSYLNELFIDVFSSQGYPTCPFFLLNECAKGSFCLLKKHSKNRIKRCKEEKKALKKILEEYEKKHQ